MDNPGLRQESFEATLRVLDENPHYVDEFFAQALKHPATLDRFLLNTARELERDDFARFAAKRLVTSPEGVKRTLVATLDEASDEPAVLKAISEAMAERAHVAAIAVVQTDVSVRAMLRALMAEVLKNPEARRAFLIGLAENADAMAQVMAPNPEVIQAMVKAFARVGLAKGKKELADLEKALN